MYYSATLNIIIKLALKTKCWMNRNKELLKTVHFSLQWLSTSFFHEVPSVTLNVNLFYSLEGLLVFKEIWILSSILINHCLHTIFCQVVALLLAEKIFPIHSFNDFAFLWCPSPEPKGLMCLNVKFSTKWSLFLIFKRYLKIWFYMKILWWQICPLTLMHNLHLDIE